MTPSEVLQLERLAKLILRVADTENWSDDNQTRRLAELALKATADLKELNDHQFIVTIVHR